MDSVDSGRKLDWSLLETSEIFPKYGPPTPATASQATIISAGSSARNQRRRLGRGDGAGASDQGAGRVPAGAEEGMAGPFGAVVRRGAATAGGPRRGTWSRS
ncbi:hypothetical protein GCM10011374_05880 [Kocuria dechangensis]|uniref:Uncharacterized protein n=1 Tax=Kocuria dechangensis TaxID=1176249 RepID=A0A917GHR1_9MICC|nr:hypothetical protein GCM10011374_05880 [Kocuria dechangensis]